MTTHPATSTDKLAAVLKALADPQRLHILRELGRTGCCSCADVPLESDGMCGCDIESVTGLSQPTVSHHLSLLERVGLVSVRKIGRWRYYRRDEGVMLRLAQELIGVFAPGCCVPSIDKQAKQ